MQPLTESTWLFDPKSISRPQFFNLDDCSSSTYSYNRPTCHLWLLLLISKICHGSCLFKYNFKKPFTQVWKGTIELSGTVQLAATRLKLAEHCKKKSQSIISWIFEAAWSIALASWRYNQVTRWINIIRSFPAQKCLQYTVRTPS